MLNTPLQWRKDPFPYAVQPQILEPSFFDSLKYEYPIISRDKGWSRMTGELMRGDENYEKLIKSSNVWRDFHNYVHSAAFLDQVISQIKHVIPQEICRIDFSKAHFIDYVEGRDLFKKKPVEYAIRRDALFIRMDLGVGEVGYVRRPHLDLRHRLASILIYFDDAEKNHAVGGNFNVLAKNDDGTYYVNDTIVPVENLGIIKIDNNKSFHSVDEIQKIDSPRRAVFIAVSGFDEVWY